MEALNGIAFFVQAAQARSFSAAGRVLGVSSSAVGKSVARLEQRLGVRLFHRSTRSITLTTEGALFLDRCRRILDELEAAELEVAETREAPRGKLRVSVPMVGGLLLPVVTAFMHRYPDIALDVDVSDRLVDVIEDGFDAVIRTGAPRDSRLMSRPLMPFQLVLVGAPAYLARRGTPLSPSDLAGHACLQHKFPSTGKIELWPLRMADGATLPDLPAAMVCNTTEVLADAARAGLGIACVPDFMVRNAIAAGELVTVLDDFNAHQGCFRILWPTSKHLAPKLRVFIDFVVAQLSGR